MGRTASSKDAESNTTYYSYDGVGNNSKITDALGHATTYEYDENNLISSTDRNGETTTYVYDEGQPPHQRDGCRGLYPQLHLY